MSKKGRPPNKNTRYSQLRKKSKSDLRKRLSKLRSIQGEYSKRTKSQGNRTPNRHKNWTWGGICEEIGRTRRILNEK